MLRRFYLNRWARALVSGPVLFLVVGVSYTFAAGKKKPAPTPTSSIGKRVVALSPVQAVRIEMPDGAIRDFGEDFQAILSTRFIEDGRYVLADGEPAQKGRIQSARSDLRTTDSKKAPPEFDWDSTFVPSATIRIHVDALSFVTGHRGGRLFYGFDERMRNRFNDGVSEGNAEEEEFPLPCRAGDGRDADPRCESDQVYLNGSSYFDEFFTPKGFSPFDSRSGLDIGDGFKIDAIIAYLGVKYAYYRSQLNLTLDFDAPLAGRREFRSIQIKGEGFFFDVAGAYQEYGGGIRFGRTAAMHYALKKAIKASWKAMDQALAGIPFTARIDHVVEDDGKAKFLLGTGRGSDVKPGVMYEVVGFPDTKIRVSEAHPKGAIGEFLSGSMEVARPGALLREAGFKPAGAGASGVQTPAGSPPTLLKPATVMARESSAQKTEGPSNADAAISPTSSREAYALPWEDIPKPDYKMGDAPDISWWQAFLKSLLDTAMLPYRIWRYFQYDQKYEAPEPKAIARAGTAPKDILAWAKETRQEGKAWARAIGWDGKPLLPVPGPSVNPEIRSPIVAVIDSGVDYNHDALQGAIFENLAAWQDSREWRDRFGWDFISGDGRAYDDHFHGTQVASLVMALAPHAKLLPLKVFNPWGVTRSAALYEAFKYAVDHGSEVIVCGWATRKHSQAIEAGVQYARDHGVMVVAAAGDRNAWVEEEPTYPAALSGGYENLWAVAAADALGGKLWAEKYRGTNGSRRGLVQFAAPGVDLRVAEPRGQTAKASSSGLAAALVAGALVRSLSVIPWQEGGRAVIEAREKLEARARRVPAFSEAVTEGRFLQLAD